MLVHIIMSTLLLLLLGGGWVISMAVVLLALLSLSIAAAYKMRWHEAPLPWMIGRFLTYKTGVRVSVRGVTLRSLQFAVESDTQTHAIATAEHIVVANPPGFSAALPLSTVGHVEILFDPWSFFTPSVFVQHIHVEDVEVHLERRDGLNNTRALRVLMDTRKRARRAGQPVPLLGYPDDNTLSNIIATGAQTGTTAVMLPRISTGAGARGGGGGGGGIISSTSESDDSDSSHDEHLDDDGGGGGGGGLRSRMAGKAAAAAKKAKAAASSALSRCVCGIPLSLFHSLYLSCSLCLICAFSLAYAFSARTLSFSLSLCLQACLPPLLHTFLSCQERCV